jgi:AcrR family transcriptional regulator
MSSNFLAIDTNMNNSPNKGRPRKFNKEEALRIALHLFWRHGFEGVSIAKLASEMGINIPSLYAAFGNKEQLFLQTVELYGKTNANIYHPALALPNAYDVARAILLAEIDLVTNPDAPDGCLMVQGALVTSPQSEGLANLMSQMRQTAEIWIKERFDVAKESGEIAQNVDTAALACFIMTINSGIAVQAKTGVNKQSLLKIVEYSLLTIKSQMEGRN